MAEDENVPEEAEEEADDEEEDEEKEKIDEMRGGLMRRDDGWAAAVEMEIEADITAVVAAAADDDDRAMMDAET